jgi:hypothetical protein
MERRRHTSLSTAQSSWRGQHSSTRFVWHVVTMGEIDAGHRGSRLAGRSKCAGCVIRDARCWGRGRDENRVEECARPSWERG